MSSRPRVNMRALLWNEALPTGCLVGALSMVPNYLTHYQWSSSPTTNFYTWTTIWLVTCLASLRFLVSPAPFVVAVNGALQSFLMLWNLYGLVGSDMSCKGVTIGEVVIAGMCTIVVVPITFFCTMRWGRPSTREQYSQDKGAGIESGVNAQVTPCREYAKV